MCEEQIEIAEIDLPPGFRRTIIAPKSGKLAAPAGTDRYAAGKLREAFL